MKLAEHADAAPDTFHRHADTPSPTIVVRSTMGYARAENAAAHAAREGMMAIQVVMGAMCACSFGVAPSALSVLPKNKTNAGSVPAANIMDNIPMTNIMPFGMCSSLANPTVASATTAALGVLTPMPCVPMTSAPWIPGSPTVLLRNMP